MFNCPVCKRRFGCLTSLQNHKKVHGNYYQAENNADTNTDEKFEEVTNTSAAEKVEEVTDTSTDKKVENVTYISTNENAEGITNISMDEDANIHSFDIYEKVEDVTYTNTDEKTEGVIDTSMDEDANIYSFNELEVISRGNNNQIFDNQDFVDEISITIDTQNIVNDQDIFEQIFLEADNEFWNDNSYCSDTNEVFPHEAYQDFVEIVIKYQLSYMPGDAILKFVKKYGQIPKRVLPQSTKDGLCFLDTLKKNHTEFISIPIAEIKNQVYPFEYQPIISAVKEILQNQELAANYRLGKNSQHSIFISLGNIPTKFCNKPKAKALVGLIPILQEILEGLQHFIPAMNDYFDLIFTLEKNIEESKITLILFESLTLPNKKKVRATKSYYNMPIFSDIAVYMDPEQDFNTFGRYCFAKVLLLVHVVLKSATTFDLALICWYILNF
ncbi:36875_t:CDS:2 [Gigaspora margarita]|uniref:36875_t:CDS:1 n=1 Tax=Gigaspora margarita TaxID=4874 RepID=A0ABM8VXJ4_GIGMA|nr:36875_t:CDS:2 [Gigaspora margarita]